MKSVSILAFAVGAYAHMEMSDPAPFRSKFNSKATEIDYSMTSPLSRAQFPCKGYLSDLGTDAGASVTTWAPGSSQSISLAGTAVHGGGSCQASLSYDKGASFTVIKSIMGGCPVAGEKIPFTVPSDAPSGEAVFAWTWFNKLGNSEMYMNCASVTIGGGSQKAKRADSTAFSSRPGMFVANLDNGCTSKQAGNVVTFPNPGPDVEGQGGSDSGISGTCEAVNGIGGDTSSGGSAPVASSPVSSPASEASSSSSEAQAPSATSTEAPVTTSEAAAPSVPGGVFITTGADAASTTQAVATSEQAQPSTSASPSSFVTSVVESSAAPSAAPSEASSTPAPSGSSDDAGSSGTKTGACTEEGNFNCVGGSQFQQCAGGLWSPARPMAPGTQCAAGESKDLIITARARSVRRRVARRSN